MFPGPTVRWMQAARPVARMQRGARTQLTSPAARTVRTRPGCPAMPWAAKLRAAPRRPGVLTRPGAQSWPAAPALRTVPKRRYCPTAQPTPQGPAASSSASGCRWPAPSTENPPVSSCLRWPGGIHTHTPPRSAPAAGLRLRFQGPQRPAFSPQSPASSGAPPSDVLRPCPQRPGPQTCRPLRCPPSRSQAMRWC